MSRSDRLVKVDVPVWWPPKPGDKLRFIDHEHVPKLCHVLALFTHENVTQFVVAHFGKHRQRWFYDIVSPSECEFGKYWPDGQEHPDPKWRQLIEQRRARGEDE